MPPELELPAEFPDVQEASPGRDALAGAHLVIVVNACWFFISHRLNIAIAAREHGCRVTVVAAPD